MRLAEFLLKVLRKAQLQNWQQFHILTFKMSYEGNQCSDSTWFSSVIAASF